MTLLLAAGATPPAAAVAASSDYDVDAAGSLQVVVNKHRKQTPEALGRGLRTAGLLRRHRVGKWAAANAHEHGFIVRYPPGAAHHQLHL